MTRLVTRIAGWPLLVIVICLSLLTLVAPSVWMNRQGLELAKRHHESVNYVEQKTVEPSAQELSPSKPEPQSNQSNPGASVSSIPAPKLSDFATARQESQILPPVAERIDLDPSVAETPPLPPTTTSAQSSLAKPTSAIANNPPANGSVPPSLSLNPAPQSDANSAAASDEPAKANSPTPPQEPVTDLPHPTTVWPFPLSLAQSLEPVVNDPESKAWGTSVLAELEALKELQSLQDEHAAVIFANLKKLAADAKPLASSLRASETRGRVLHLAYGITRRVDVWQQITNIAKASTETEETLPQPKQLLSLIQAVDARVRQLSNAASWQEFLQLTKIRDMLAESPINMQEVRKTVRRVLIRMDAPALTEPQYAFFREPLFTQFGQHLKTWANEPVDYREILTDLERYETSHATSDAQRVARLYQVVRWSPKDQIASLGDQMNMHYRNANVRVAVSEQLINRMIPEQQAIEEDVNDEILGARVLGRSLAATRLRVVLFPDRRQWRLGLVANGQAVSETESYKGGAVFRNDGSAQFQARKMLLVDRRGVKVGQAEADADVQSDLRDFETEFDGIPIFNFLARSIARQQYEEKSAAAQGEMRDRVAWRASSRFDEEVHRRLAQAEKQFEEKLMRPLRELDLKPTAVDMETTESRLIIRERLAGHEQLGAHTPRPQAPGSSWLSVQLHESALNNALEHLNLDGKRTDLHSLYREMTARFDRPDAKIPEDLPEDVTVHFADTDSVRVRCEDGRVTLTVRLQELSQNRSNTWKNFVVRAHYKPLPDQTEANLMRDGVIELVGERLSFGDQVKLRGIFAKVLSRNSNIAVVNKKLAENPRLSDFRVNQFVVENGWIGVAVEPGVVANRAATPKKQR